MLEKGRLRLWHNAPWAHLGLLGLLGLGGPSCSPSGTAGIDGILVRLHPSIITDTAARADLTATAKSPAGQDAAMAQSFTQRPFDVLGVTFPAGTRGPTSYQLGLFDDASCQLASGQASYTLDSDGVFEVPLAMTASSLCGSGAKVDVQVANLSGGSGSVSSAPAGINCQGGGTGCSASFAKGTQVTLTATASTGAFAGWSGGTCTGLGPCTFTVAQDVQIQAIFTACHGWCPEKLPFAVTANLNGVWGTAANNVVVVGDSGTALRWDGATWQQLQPPSGAAVPLYAVAGKAGVPAVSVAGGGGTVLQLTGTTWKQITNSSQANLRAAAIGLGTSPSTYFVGDNGTALMLANNGNSVSQKNTGTTTVLYGLSENPNGSKDDLYITGAISGGRGYARSWDGNGSFTDQMTGATNITGNIYAMLCGVAYHYAAGDGGMIVRRSSASNNSGNWMVSASTTTQIVRGLWASADNNIYAVGDAGTILQFDGSAWNKVNSNTTTNLRAVWGSSFNNIYAVGEGGVVLHYLP